MLQGVTGPRGKCLQTSSFSPFTIVHNSMDIITDMSFLHSPIVFEYAYQLRLAIRLRLGDDLRSDSFKLKMQ